jgi:glucose/arabinose dehydrogenase
MKQVCTLASMAILAQGITLTASAQQPIALTSITTGLSFPLDFVQDPAAPTLQYIVEQTGLIRVLQNGALETAPFADFSAEIGATTGEQGLLGFAIDPANTGVCYAAYTDATNTVNIARFMRDGTNPLLADLTTLTVLLTLGQPFPNNNGGHIDFGPDGFLYIALGDGGAPSDFQGRGQNPLTLWATILRVDVSDTAATVFTAPPDNPFVGDFSGNNFVWHYGVRNPWRFSWDTGNCSTGAMMVADLGQDTMDEVNAVPGALGGVNFGWSCKEGTIAFSSCANDPGLTDPIHAYSGTSGQSVTGGFVYRGAKMPHNRGRFIFGDFISGQIWSFQLIDNGDATFSQTGNVEMLSTGRFISSFGRDAAGELYILDYFGGELLRIDPTNPQADLDLDNMVNGADLGLFLGLWGATDCQLADLNNDAVVNGADLGLLLGQWTP